MKITEWLGYNEQSSQYRLRRGELRALVNLQPRRLGMLISRRGMRKLFGSYSEEPIFGMYRKDTPFGQPDVYFIFHKVEVEKIVPEGTVVDPYGTPLEYVWMVSRLSGYPFQSRVIDQQPLSPNGLTQITNISVAEDRFGRVFIFYGHGAKPKMFRITTSTATAVDMGLSAPTDAPVVSVTGDGFFLERVDITSPGGAYWGPPTITIAGGNPSRPAIVKGIVQSGNLVGVEVVDGGSNYATPPKLTIGTDKMGVGFRGIGVIETDPGYYGFVDTATPTYGSRGRIGESQVYSTTNTVGNTKVLYLSSPVSCNTTCTTTAVVTGATMTVASVANVQVGDYVTVYPLSGAARPAAFADDLSPRRVVAINTSTNTVTLNKSWTNALNAAYNVQFRRNTTLTTADATYDPSSKTYAASLPLRTLMGCGNEAYATVKFAAGSDAYALGTLTRSGYTTPTGGPSASKFAYKDVGWDVYQIKGVNYWNGHPSNAANDPTNMVYAGLQASGSSFVYGYSGAVRTSRQYRRTVDRRADVYWPDYSKISVWSCTGLLSDNIAEWQRQDVEVLGRDTTQPYVLVTLQPCLKSRTVVRARRGRRQTISTPYGKQETFRAPVVRINLAFCPDSWIITGNNGLNYTSNIKEAGNDRLPWWNNAGTTPRPIVDVRGDQSGVRLDYGTIEVVDPGSGWEKDTVFALRLFQANAYTQINDFNVGVQEPSRGGAHASFSKTSRYVSFLFQATAEDVSPVAGPPAEILDPVSVDISGSEYRSGDLAAITLARREKTSSVETRVARFLGYISTTGQATELVFSSWSGSGTYTQAGRVITITSAGHGLTEGDFITFTATSGGSATGSYRVASTPSSDTFTLDGSVEASTSGSCNLSMSNKQSTGAVITRVSEGDLISARISTRDIVKCETASVLFDFSQVMVVDTAGGTLAIDKMAYPRASLLTTFSGTAVDTSDIITGVTATDDYLVAGQPLRVVSGSMSNPVCTILSVTDAGNGTKTLRLNITATANGSVTFGPAFYFSVFSGAREAETLRWTASQISTGGSAKKVTSVRILNAGRNYYAAPQLLSRGGGTGYGLVATANVSDGRVTSVTIVDPGIDYTSSPEVYASSDPATATPVMRPAMTGRYRCAYRFCDRSETVILNTTITAIAPNATTVTLASTEGIKAGMVVESERFPYMTRVLGVGQQNKVTMTAAVTGRGPLSRVEITDPGSGYAQNEVVTATLTDLSLPGWSCTVSLIANASGSFSVREAAPVGSVPGGQMVEVGEYTVAFSAPAAGGTAASGRATVTALDPAAGYSKAVTIRDMTKPISYSDFSPIVDVDAGPNETRQQSSEMVWNLSGVQPPERADMVEFFRTSSDQSLVFYRLEIYGKPTSSGITIVGKDTLTDEELFDPDRANYAAVPVVLPNGGVNAYRFGQPRTDMSVCVAFQDRLWYGVSTSGKDSNTLFYSEFDEFESCPDVNELPIQNNQRSTDSLTAIVPFGSMLLAIQHNHTYAITYNTDPGLDASIQMVSHRGCLNQRCWDIHDNLLYAADENGIYVFSRSGELQPISEPIKEFFTSELLDLSARDNFFLTVCSRARILRFYCSFAAQPTPTPSVALCYHLDQKTWWVERFPNSMSSAVTGRPQTSRLNCSIYGAADGNMYEFYGDSDVAHRGIMSCKITNPGDGYRVAPKITCPAGYGVQLQAVVNEGRLVDVLVHSTGWDVRYAWQLFTQDGRAITTENDAYLTTQLNAPIPLTIEAPPEGGIQAEAEGIFSNITRLPYRCSVVAGQDYVTILTAPQYQVDVTEPPFLSGENGDIVETEGGDFVVVETTPIEVGMEAFSECLPLGAIVKEIIGPQVFLEFENGAALQALNTNANAQVIFIKKYKSHVPFRLATGALQLINETNVQKGGDTLIDRSITVLYAPTTSDKYLEVVEYYNTSTTPRANVHRRNRGGSGGFEHRQDSASTVLNMAEDASHLAAATGVAKATFACSTYADLTGPDRHIRVELHGRPGPANKDADLTPQQFVMHSLTIDGVIEDAE